MFEKLTAIKEAISKPFESGFIKRALLGLKILNESIDEEKKEVSKSTGEKIFSILKKVIQKFLLQNNSTEAPEQIPEGSAISEKQIQNYLNTNPNLSEINNSSKPQENLLKLIEEAKKSTALPEKLNHRFNALKDHKDYPAGNGEKCCAFTVSTFLGLGEDGSSTKDKVGSVRGLATRLIKRNLDLHKTPGVIFGFNNYNKGDVVIFRQATKEGSEERFSHTAIVRFRKEISVYDKNGNFVGKEEYIALQDDGEDLQATLIPVNPNSSTQTKLAEALNDNPNKEEYLEKHYKNDTDIMGLWKFRSSHPETFRTRPNRDWWGDTATTPNGRIAFAIRTGKIKEKALT
ncbi:hypothetical protein COU74_01520 [Candidatus Peregrinibacteria bacterium CG10_big_fil_rev_8_21_14_0_10_36_19]|nr:MAG: hypothetical protein COU74_01520 [Candidatus Peregrinibacteria bacterium CG10_big_fil_rev_8_21_14_0_10_36_19]